MANNKPLPEPGTDLQYDRLREVINNIALKDPETLYTLCLCMLRYFKSNGLHTLVMSWDDMATHGLGPAGADYCGIGFALDIEGRHVGIMALDATTPAGITAQAVAHCPDGIVHGIQMPDPDSKPQ